MGRRTGGERSQEINSAQRTLQGSGTVTWFCAYDEQNKKRRKETSVRGGRAWRFGGKGWWRERRGWEEERKNNNATSLWEAGSNERKGGSCYKVIRPELMVNKATTACLVTLSKHHSCWGAFKKISCFVASFLLSPRLQWSITLLWCFLHRVPASQSVMTVKHRSSLLYRVKSSRHLSSFPLILAGSKENCTLNTVTNLSSEVTDSYFHATATWWEYFEAWLYCSPTRLATDCQVSSVTRYAGPQIHERCQSLCGYCSHISNVLLSLSLIPPNQCVLPVVPLELCVAAPNTAEVKFQTQVKVVKRWERLKGIATGHVPSRSWQSEGY